VDTTTIVLIVVIVLLVVALAAAGLMISRRRRSEQLQDHYGSEYERTLAETGDRRAAEAELTEREKRHSQLDVRELSPEERDGFAASWTRIQQGFVDDPVRSVHEADALVVEIMRTRGYPVDDFDRRAEDVSVEHPKVAARYREAREIRVATENGTADTEQQRHAVTSYRELIEALLGHGSSGDDATPAAQPQNNGRHAHTTTEEHTR
jgi:FtsZ-interacting cell division protein ZipA